MSTDQAIEQEIQAKGKTAPRITPADIEANIAKEFYFTAADGVVGALVDPYEERTVEDFPDWNAAANNAPMELFVLTFCVLVLRNGFTVIGESACASPENFDEEIGKKIARQNAVAKIWPLMGYELRTQLSKG